MEEPSALLHNTDGCCRRDLLTGDFIKIGEREGATQELCVVVNCDDVHRMGWLTFPQLSSFIMAGKEAANNPDYWAIFIFGSPIMKLLDCSNKVKLIILEQGILRSPGAMIVRKNGRVGGDMLEFGPDGASMTK